VLTRGVRLSSVSHDISPVLWHSQVKRKCKKPPLEAFDFENLQVILKNSEAMQDLCYRPTRLYMTPAAKS
jgi:hypothetical protein